MFTGITERVGKIESLERATAGNTGSEPDGGRLRVSLLGAAEISAHMKLGDSISVSGCCLTVVDFSANHFSADLSGETLRRTSLGEKKPGDLVNLERPLAIGGQLGGHFVQGHVDGTGRVTRLAPEGDNWWLSIRVPEDLLRYIAEKASIAIDGVSLTVARWHPPTQGHAERRTETQEQGHVEHGIADIAVIPFTYSHTSVRALAPGSAVNLEVDILAKYVESLLDARKSSPASRLAISKLLEEGF